MSKCDFRPESGPASTPSYPTDDQFELTRRTFIAGVAASALVGAEACTEAGAESLPQAVPVPEHRMRGEPPAPEVRDGGIAAPRSAAEPRPPGPGELVPPPRMPGAPPMPTPKPDGGVEEPVPNPGGTPARIIPPPPPHRTAGVPRMPSPPDAGTK